MDTPAFHPGPPARRRPLSVPTATRSSFSKKKSGPSCTTNAFSATPTRNIRLGSGSTHVKKSSRAAKAGRRRWPGSRRRACHQGDSLCRHAANAAQGEAQGSRNRRTDALGEAGLPWPKDAAVTPVARRTALPDHRRAARLLVLSAVEADRFAASQGRILAQVRHRPAHSGGAGKEDMCRAGLPIGERSFAGPRSI